MIPLIFILNGGCPVTSSFTGEFVSDSIVINNFWEGPSETGDKCKQEVAWSSVIDINSISGLDSIELWVVSFDEGDGGLWFINKAESIEWVSKLIDVKEIFGSFL